MPPPSGRAVSHMWSYFLKQPINVLICTCQICESEGAKILLLISCTFSKDKYFKVFANIIILCKLRMYIKFIVCVYVLSSGTRSFNKHLAKKHGVTKETHATSANETTIES